MRLAFWRKTATTRVEDIARDEIAARIYAAADLIETKGWIQGSLKSRKGYCVLGALLEVGGEIIPSESRLNYYLRDSELAYSVLSWNDTQASSKEEVVSLLRAAANYVPKDEI